ncbi:MAG: hypothetical protein EAZ70_04955 [Runella slithyformis]|nr:MAG: hypothetical protein EAY79_04350 [Runella slithyformis]TAF02364.1 MAG: hypothetical protein EAZ80_01305 [Runella slithyformis]TAF28587.1 MAG: hypothetical protein EAZ70_04955 [Runella slithyformis]TAF47614.1 MAG: hypothetical protein EAZ63_07345 [Runella slithyformis]
MIEIQYYQQRLPPKRHAPPALTEHFERKRIGGLVREGVEVVSLEQLKYATPMFDKNRLQNCANYCLLVTRPLVV